jgi:hypothetical protein
MSPTPQSVSTSGHNRARRAPPDMLDRLERMWWDLAYGRGYAAGWADGIAKERDAWNKIMGVYRQAVKRPTFAELEAARRPKAAS